jgi:hypothetical protein
MDDLRTQYKGQLDSYDTLLKDSLDADDVTQIPKLRTLNVKLAFTIDEMVNKLEFMKKETPSIKAERDELIQTLTRIQQDYSGLIVATDSLETLRRIRQQVKFDADRQLRMYLLFFFLLALCIVFYLMFMTQRKDTTAAMASTPPTMAALV